MEIALIIIACITLYLIAGLGFMALVDYKTAIKDRIFLLVLPFWIILAIITGASFAFSFINGEIEA